MSLLTLEHPLFPFIFVTFYILLHPNSVPKDKSKNDACRDFGKQRKEADKCMYRASAPDLARNPKLREDKIVWDIEDLVGIGEKEKSCPYYAARTVAKEQAELIFCPYNYLLDPNVRKALDINLANAIVILDEAHNIESVAMDAASLEVDHSHLQAAIENINQVSLVIRRPFMSCFEQTLKIVGELFTEESQKLEADWKDDNDYDLPKGIWDGAQARAMLIERGMGVNAVSTLLSSIQEYNSYIQKNQVDRELGDGTTNLLASFQTLLSIFHKDNNVRHYYMVVHSSKPNSPTHHSRKRMLVWTLSFWCMHPGVGFTPLSDKTRSVILTSGTLSPMDSFASELDTPFPIRLEARHVVQGEQVWAACVPKSKHNVPLNSRYSNASKPEYQDALAECIIGMQLGFMDRFCRDAPCFLFIYFFIFLFFNNLADHFSLLSLSCC